MSLTITRIDRLSETVMGNKKLHIYDITFDSSYPTGGESLTPSELGMVEVLGAFPVDEFGGYIVDYIRSTNKLMARATSGGWTPAGTNAVSVVDPEYDADPDLCTKPTITLTHNADPVTNLDAASLYAYEAQGNSINNIIFLESTTDDDTSILGETADGVGGGVTASCRFWVKDNDTPNGVKIYVAEDTGNRLEFVSPTGADGYIIMPFEQAAGGVPGFAVAVKVYHAADAATGSELFFDDDGVADAQLCFVDAGTTGGTIPTGDITIIGPGYLANAAGGAGQAAAQVFTGAAQGETEGDEVDATTDLSSVTGRMAFIGH